MTKRRQSKIDREISKMVNSLTPEQYSKLLDIAHGEVPEEIKTMTDDELLAELAAY